MTIMEHNQLGVGSWQERLEAIVATMREMSQQTDPQEMVNAYGRRLGHLFRFDRRISLSRRGLEPPQVRVTRSSLWKENINPWKEKHRLPTLEGGLFSELIYGDEPRIIDDLQLADDDPAKPYLEGQGSLMAIPLFGEGVSLNMVVVTLTERAAFSRETFPEMVWLSNLFGRATHNLVLADEVKTAYNLVDQELKSVADIQRSLLPSKLPNIPNVDLAVHYETSRRAGGDYYDFFELPDGKWGILIADVSGHGTPAAVMMAVTHSIAHSFPGPSIEPSQLLDFVNQKLTKHYTRDNGTFVTAFYGTYDPTTREFIYACAGHNAPRLKRCGDGSVTTLDGAPQFPLGISHQTVYEDCSHILRPGDRILFFTDGITEALNERDELFGNGRLDEILGRCRSAASEVIEDVLAELDKFTNGLPATDDRTLLAASIL